MIRLSEAMNVLRNVKIISIWRDTKTNVDMNNKEKYEVVSVSSIYGKNGLHIYVKEI